MTTPFDRVPVMSSVVIFLSLRSASNVGVVVLERRNRSAMPASGWTVTSLGFGAISAGNVLAAAVLEYRTRTPAARALSSSPAILGMLAMHSGRVAQVGFVTSKTPIAVVFASSATAT